MKKVPHNLHFYSGRAMIMAKKMVELYATSPEGELDEGALSKICACRNDIVVITAQFLNAMKIKPRNEEFNFDKICAVYECNPDIIDVNAVTPFCFEILQLVTYYDVLVRVIDTAWLDNCITLKERNETIRQTEGRIYNKAKRIARAFHLACLST